jgi:hypothetical protein
MSIPSDPTQGFLFGYSQNRLLMMVVFVAGILTFGGLFWLSWKKNIWDNRTANRIDAFFQKDLNGTTAVGILSVGLVFSIIYLGFAYSNLDYRVPQDAVTSMEQVKVYMYRIAPFFIWVALILGQALVLLSLAGYATRAKYLQALKTLAVAIFPIFLIFFWGFNRIDPYYYNRLTKEDNIVEWLTVIFLLLGSILSVFHAVKIKPGMRQYLWFFVLYALACSLFAIEEISWGQRIFNVKSPEYFVEHSDQQEINIHNVVNQRFNVRTKHVASLGLLAYGAALPILGLSNAFDEFTHRLGIIIPPPVLIPGFLIGSFMTWDRYFNGQDEEVAEFFFSILLLLVMVFQFWVFRPRQQSGSPAG